MRDPMELPEIKDASTGTLSLGTSLDIRMPSMPAGETQDMGFTNAKQEDAAKLMDEIRASYAITREQSRRSNAKARARNRQAQRQAERR